MKITICGSIAFIDEMYEIKSDLEELGHEIKIPPLQQLDNDGNPFDSRELYILRQQALPEDHWIWDIKERAMRMHFDKVTWGDAVLVLNKTKNNVENYIGANTLLEMGLAFHQNKPIYIYHGIPEISYKEEILGMKPLVLDGNLLLISTPQSVPNS